MHRFMVKIKTAAIFKGIHEMQKSTPNEENFAKNHAWETRGSCVNQVQINHDAAHMAVGGLLTKGWGTNGRPSPHPVPPWEKGRPNNGHGRTPSPAASACGCGHAEMQARQSELAGTGLG